MTRFNGMRLLAAKSGEHDVHEVVNFTIETDMRTGEAVVILVISDKPESTSARDFEPHPAFEDVNEWLWS